MNKKSIFFKSAVATLIVLLILLLKPQFVHRSSWIGSSGPSTFGLGWPMPYLVWDISKWPEGVNTPLSQEERIFIYWTFNKFLVRISILGFIYSFIFWYLITIISMYLLTLINNVAKKLKYK